MVAKATEEYPAPSAPSYAEQTPAAMIHVLHSTQANFMTHLERLARVRTMTLELEDEDDSAVGPPMHLIWEHAFVSGDDDVLKVPTEPLE